MIHFTLTGRYAGQTYCGAPRSQQDTFMHPRFDAKFQQTVVHSSEMCPQCKEVYNSAGDED